MTGEYVEECEGGHWVKGSRVSLDSVVYAFLAGQTAESIAQSFPSLALKQVYGTITFYLANREQVDAYLAKARADFESVLHTSREADPTFYQKLANTRLHQQAVQP